MSGPRSASMLKRAGAMVQEMQLEVRELMQASGRLVYAGSAHHVVLDGCLIRDEAAQSKGA